MLPRRIRWAPVKTNEMSNPDVQQARNDEPPMTMRQIVEQWQLMMREEMNAAVLRAVMQAHLDVQDYEDRHARRNDVRQD